VDSSVAPEGLSEDVLLARFAFGDDEAGRLFIRRFQGQVYGLALAILRDPALAEDVAQETFVRAWRHGPTYDPGRGTVAAWLLRITRNLAIDALRLRGRTDVMDPDVLAVVLPPSAVSVEDAAVTGATASAVREALRSLPEEQARALLLATFYGRTAEEIARADGIPLGTAKTRIRLGLRRVRGLLAAPAEEA